MGRKPATEKTNNSVIEEVSTDVNTTANETDMEKEYKEQLAKKDQELENLKKLLKETSNNDKKKPFRLQDIDKTHEFAIKNNTMNRVCYIADDHSCSFDMSSYGDIEYISFKDLIKMKNSHIRYFSDNWITIEDDDMYNHQDIYEAIGVSKYYTGYNLDDFDSLLHSAPEDIIRTINSQSMGVKDIIKDIAIKKYKEKKIDSIKTVEALNQALGIDLKEM